MEIREAPIYILEQVISDPCRGLREEIFLLVSRITPLVNVDLLIQDQKRRTLLTWRDDGFYGPGWHLPGGIIRFKEAAATRIREVARKELGVEVEFDSVPLAVNEVIHPTCANRGHSISLLYRCKLLTLLDEWRRYKKEKPQSGDWEWHATFPEDMIPVHQMYSPFFK